MARTKWTARKSTRPPVRRNPASPTPPVPTPEPVQEPAPAPEQLPDPEVLKSDGLQAGEMPLILLELLQQLGFAHAPEYKGHKTYFADHVEWSVGVTIYEREMQDGAFKVLSTHQAIASRESFKAGIEDAARQALHRICEMYKEDLFNTTYHYYPTRKRGDPDTQVRGTEYELNSLLTEQVRMTTALSKNLDEALYELEEAHERNVGLLEIVRRQHHQLFGGPAPSEPASWDAPSPLRKRPRQDSDDEAESSDHHY